MATVSTPVGELLRECRGRRGLSQLDLALSAEVSSRHISFLETGRARPSRKMVLRLAETLELPLLDRNALLVAAFAAVALGLALIGVYGVVSYLVSQRTHEIGVRLALGARPSDIIRLVVGRGLVPAALGVVLGMSGAFVLARYLAGMLFRVEPVDPMTFLLTPLAVLIVAALACYLPARRATQLDPLMTLRGE